MKKTKLILAALAFALALTFALSSASFAASDTASADAAQPIEGDAAAEIEAPSAEDGGVSGGEAQSGEIGSKETPDEDGEEPSPETTSAGIETEAASEAMSVENEARSAENEAPTTAQAPSDDALFAESVTAESEDQAAESGDAAEEEKRVPTLFETVRDNAAYVAGFAAIIVGVFAVAAVFERFARKRSGDKRVSPARRAAVIGVFSALAFVLFLLEFPLPFLAPSFYKLDFSEIPVLIGAYAFGPVAGVTIELIKIVLKIVVKGTTTAFVGELANFVVGCSFVLPASIIYHFNKTKKGAIVSGAVGTVGITAFGSFFNAVYLLPTFAVLFHMPMDQIVAMGQEIIPAIKDVPTFALFAVAPFNLIKGASVTIFTMLVYKKLSPILKTEDGESTPENEKSGCTL